VFKTPGKLRGKTPRTARKKAAEPRQVRPARLPLVPCTDSRQPLASLGDANKRQRASPAELSLKGNLLKQVAKARFEIAEDENTVRVQSPAARTPLARQLFSKALSTGKENASGSFHADAFAQFPSQSTAAPWSPVAHSTQDTAMSSQADGVFSPPRTQSTQPTQPTQSFGDSLHEKEDERRDTGDSFVSANEAFASKNASRENLRQADDDAMDIDDKAGSARSSAQDTVIRHEFSSAGEEEDEDMQDIPNFPEPPRVVSEQYSISAETPDALDTAHLRAHAPEAKTFFAPESSTTPAGLPPALLEDAHDDIVLHHDVEDQMDIDDDVRSPSEHSSPVKPLVRKSSLTFASLPAREPLLPKKSMGNRVSRTSHVDPSKARNSQMDRYTGGKSLGGNQLAQPADAHLNDDMDVDDERPVIQREESETTKIHNKTSTQRLFERINMLKQQNEAPKRTSQNIVSSQSSQPQSLSSAQPKEDPPPQLPQPAYPVLFAPEPVQDDDDDDWISPVRTVVPAPNPSRPALSKSHTADIRPSPAKPTSKLISVSNPDLTTVAESTTPVGSPAGKKYMDGPLSASKAKFYSALRAAKEKIIGSSTTSAQVKLDALAERPVQPRLQAHESSDDVFGSPKRVEKPGLFSHLRSPSKESSKSGKSNKISAVPGSPTKEDSRRTRSSTERQKQKFKDAQEKESKDAKQKQRAEDKLRDMREKEQSKAAAQHEKNKVTMAKTPSAMSSQSSLRQPAPTKTPTPTYPTQQPLPRPAVSRSNTASSREQDMDSADEMPPPPPPKSLLPTTKTTKAALREPRKITKPTSKETISKAKAPQKIMVNLNSSRYGQAPPPAARPVPAQASKPLPAAPKATAPVPRPPPAPRPASALSSKSGAASKAAPPAAKPAAPRVARPQPQVVEKAKAPAPQPRADMGTARPVSRMQTVQDANRIVVPPVNPAKPAKRPFQGDGDETINRPAKRPSQQAKMSTTTPAHAHFGKGKIPFAEPAYAPQPQQPQIPQIQYPNGDDIKLPEIMTDSEDEDSENEFEQPSWVNTPNLREMLTSQQLMDPEQIFGPIAPLNMEAVFPNKERHKRFRERTSSAFWANDQVTDEEKRKEREARERLVRDGAWTYNPSPRPTPGPSRLG
jgi:hypothetical protein